jgi:hypothetical protein
VRPLGNIQLSDCLFSAQSPPAWPLLACPADLVELAGVSTQKRDQTQAASGGEFNECAAADKT